MAKSFKRRNESGDESASAAYQLLVESSFDGVLALSSEGNILWADNRFLNLVGYDSSEIENQPLSSFMDPGDEEKVNEYLSRSLEQSHTFDVRAINKSGKVRIFQLVTALCGEEEEQEIIIGVRDISEEDALRRRIVFTDKMDLLSRVMDSIGGDLGHITSTLGTIATGSGDPRLEEALDWLSELEHRVDIFPPRRGIKNGADVDIPTLVGQAIAAVRKENTGSSCDIQLSIEDGIFPVFSDTVQLSEAILNVLRNACQAADSNNGDVKVSCRPVSVDRATPKQGFILPPGEYVHLTITDTGPGISPDIIDHVFDPLFSTKTGSPLAGMGLAVTYTIVKNHRGNIALESDQESGTTVELYLPKSKFRKSIAKPPPTEAPAVEEPITEAEDVVEESTEVVEESTEIVIEVESEIVTQDVSVEKASEETQEVEVLEIEVDVETAVEEKTEIETVAETTVEEKTEIETVAEAETAVEKKPVIETVAETETAVEKKPVIETVAETETAVEKKTEIETEAAVETAVEKKPVIETVAEAETAVEKKPEIETVAEATVEEKTEIETVAEVEEDVLGEDEIRALSGHETILVIEEDHEICAYIVETIDRFGYNALPARNWVEGVDIYKRHPRLVDLVLLNVLLPEMVWVKTLMDLQRIEPKGRISLMGGEETSETMIRYLNMPGINYLAKPLSVTTLMRGVRFSLDEQME